MCTGIVGRVVELDADAPPGAPTGVVRTGEGRRAVCFAFLPDAVVGDVVLVHSGYAINRLEDSDIQDSDIQDSDIQDSDIQDSDLQDSDGGRR